MFLRGTIRYITFISLWILGFYFILKTFDKPTKKTKLAEDRIEYLQNEVNTLRTKLFELQAAHEKSNSDER